MKSMLFNKDLPEVKEKRPRKCCTEIINAHQTCYPKAIFHGK
jgi:hypothetical protein